MRSTSSRPKEDRSGRSRGSPVRSQDLAVSPDGKRLAFRGTLGEPPRSFAQPDLYVVDLTAGAAAAEPHSQLRRRHRLRAHRRPARASRRRPGAAGLEPRSEGDHRRGGRAGPGQPGLDRRRVGQGHEPHAGRPGGDGVRRFRRRLTPGRARRHRHRAGRSLPGSARLRDHRSG